MIEEVVDELVGLSDTALDDRIRTNELERRRLDTELAMAVSIAEQRQLHAADGHRSMTAYLRATLNYSTAEASRVRSLGRAINGVDGFGEQWLAGRIGRPQAVEFARLHANRRVRDQLASFAPLLLTQAEQLSHREFAGCVERFVCLADTDGAHADRDQQIEHRDANVVEVGGSLDVRAHGGDALTTAEMIEVFAHYEHVEFRADLAARRVEHGADADAFPLARTAKQRRYDALIAIFRAAAASETAGGPADAVVNIVIDANTWARLLAETGLAPSTDLAGTPVDPFTGLTDPDDLLDDLIADPDARCATDRGQQLHPHDVLQAALAGHIRRIVVNADGTVIDRGRKTRCFTGSARHAAMLLITRCEHPGCDLPADFCHVDHATEWADNGPTDQTNARIRCGLHNREKHRRRWQSVRATNKHTYTVREDGTIMMPVGARPPTLIDPPDASTNLADDQFDTGINSALFDLDSEEPAEIARIDEHIRQRVRALTR